ncbi:hypothetical protein [Bacteroides acidifaciens]|uniref:hypothetical protein n=1 Tax=Bacteroides acidifaciens TaxID=85831 RepID=UPI00263AD99D|nr:hypothetical protein [Bacteroides acidifaciens]
MASNVVLNEASFMDIIRAVTAAANGVNDAVDATQRARTNSKTYSYSSVNRAASSLIAVYPILCSSNCKLETSSMIQKYIERKQCIYLQLVITAANLTNAESGMEYLRNFHQNLAGTTSMADVERMLSNYFGESADVKFDVSTEVLEAVVEKLKKSYTQYYTEDYSSLSLADYHVTGSNEGYTVGVRPYVAKYASLHEAGGRQDTGSRNPNKLNNPALTDTDVKKANEAVPSLIIVNFLNKQTQKSVEFLIGVKAKLIPTDYLEILNKIVTKNKDAHGLANLIRATSGEINFFTDYLLGLNAAKESIKRSKIKGSRESIWNQIEFDSSRAKYNLSQNKVNMASAITTVVITAEDADMLLKEENLDIRNLRNAKAFLRAYNLNRFIIANDIEESLMSIEDNDNPTFETLAYTMLERESSDGQYKKILNLMAKK